MDPGRRRQVAWAQSRVVASGSLGSVAAPAARVSRLKSGDRACIGHATHKGTEMIAHGILLWLALQRRGSYADPVDSASGDASGCRIGTHLLPFRHRPDCLVSQGPFR